MAGFLLLEIRTLHRTSFDYSPQAAHPSGASAARALFNASGVSPSPGTTYLKKPAYGLVFCFSAAGLSIELRSIIRRKRLTPSVIRAAVARCLPTFLFQCNHGKQRGTYCKWMIW
jgi:hypothetical protein